MENVGLTYIFIKIIAVEIVEIVMRKFAIATS